MTGLKAITAGIITIIVLGLVNQLVVIMANVGFSSLAKSYEIFSPYINLLTYIVGGMGYFVVMFSGGFVTAAISREKIYQRALIAGVIASSASLWWSLRTDIFTPIAVVFLLAGVLFTLLGSWSWTKSRFSHPLNSPAE